MSFTPSAGDSEPVDRDPRRFATTHWSLVLAAGRTASPESRKALAWLCEAYWFPLYAFARRSGHSGADAEDLTQSFFADLLARDDLRGVRPEKGRFRTFLLAALNHFMSNERDRAQAAKRGGGKRPLSLDAAGAEARWSAIDAKGRTPVEIFDREWALTILERVSVALRDEYRAAGKGDLFDRLQRSLAGDPQAGSYREDAAALGTTEGALRVAAHRLRQRYRDILREEIGRTLAEPDEVEAEIAELFAVLSG